MAIIMQVDRAFYSGLKIRGFFHCLERIESRQNDDEFVPRICHSVENN